jgi:hypothetical protein
MVKGSLVLCAATIAAGCHVDSSPRTVSELGPGHSGRVISAPYDGDYTPYKVLHRRAADDEAGEFVTQVHLQRGRRLGFQRDDLGELLRWPASNPCPSAKAHTSG